MSIEAPGVMIGIAGPSCSGKTTLAENLEAHLQDEVSVLPFDDLLIGVDILIGRGIEDWEDPAQYRWDDYRRHMQALKDGQEVVVDARSPASMEEGVETRVIQPRPIVVAAGFLALHDEEVNGLFDTTAFIDLPEEEMLRRRWERANPENPWDKPGYIAGSLVSGTRRHVLPQRDRAEHVLDGMKSQHELVEDTLRIIRSVGLR